MYCLSSWQTEDALKEFGDPVVNGPSEMRTADSKSLSHLPSLNEPRGPSLHRHTSSLSLLGQVWQDPLAAATASVVVVLLLLLLLAMLYLGAGVWEATRSLREIAGALSRQAAVGAGDEGGGGSIPQADR